MPKQNDPLAFMEAAYRTRLRHQFDFGALRDRLGETLGFVQAAQEGLRSHAAEVEASVTAAESHLKLILKDLDKVTRRQTD